MTFAFLLAAADPPDDVGAPHRYAESPAARRAREEAIVVAARDRRWADALRAADPAPAHKAFNDIVDAYGDRLIRFAYGLVKSTDAAQDLVQDVLLRVWERRLLVRPEDSLRAYLLTSVRRAALNLLKRQTVELRYATSALHDISGSQTPAIDEQFDAESIARAVPAALERLSERRRTALHLRYEQELPFAVVAEVMGLTEPAVKHLVKRAVVELRRYLGL